MVRRFTLVELMIVVAIISILAAIAVPQFQAMTLRSRLSEQTLNVSGISDAQVGYFSANDAIANTPAVPSVGIAGLGKQANPWETGTTFEDLGWAPDGDVRCIYETHPGGKGFEINSYCNVDGDASYNLYHELFFLQGTGGSHYTICYNPIVLCNNATFCGCY